MNTENRVKKDNIRNNRNTKKSIRSRLVKTFLITLTGVVTIGLIFLIVADKINENSAHKGNVHDIQTGENDKETSDGTKSGERIISLFEPIPEDEMTDEVLSDFEQLTEGSDEPDKRQAKYDDILSDAEYMKENNIYSVDSANESCVTLTFAGDILFDPNYAVMAKLRENGGEISAGIDDALLEDMRNSDVMMLNNEFPYSDRGEPLAEKTYTFRAKRDSVRYLSDMGVDIVSLANNHAYDYGESAFIDTVSTLEDAGIPFVGGGRNIDEACRPVYFIVNDIKIGFLSATQIERVNNPDTKEATANAAGVFRCLDNTRLLKKIEETKQNCDFLVVYIHWGTESTIETDWAQNEQAPQMADAGADLIIGDHPHVLQPIAKVKGIPVVYSLGNFWFNSFDIDTGLFQTTINENGIVNMRFIPAKQSGCKTKKLYGADAQNLYSYIQAMSPTITIDSEGYISF